MSFKEFVFVFTIPFTFPEIMKALFFVEHHQHLVFKILVNSNQQEMEITSLSSAKFKLSGSSFLSAFDTV